jgi:hypothetical protein
MSSSVSLAYRRTLHLIHALQRGPQERSSLQSLVCRMEGEDAYGEATGRALQKAFEEDLRRAREQFGITIRYDRAHKNYEISDIAATGWIDAPDHVLRSLVLLYHTFDEDAPEAAEVRATLDWLVHYLPAERQAWLQNQRLGYQVELRELDPEINPLVEERVRQAVRERRELSFHYLSPRHASEQPVVHLVAPRELVHRDGHWYLIATDLERTDESGTTYPRQQKRFRLSYMLPGRLLVRPDKVPLTPYPPRRYRLRYRLHPDLARGSISFRFDNMSVRYAEDGWAEVQAETTDLFHAAQTLFRYADKCKVQEPQEIVEMIRGWLWEMMELYEPR